MRTPTITTQRGDSCDPPGWHAEAVDPSGWLAGAGSTSQLPRAGQGGASGRSTGSGERAAARAARRSTTARRRRRVQPRSRARSLTVGHAPADQALGRPVDAAQLSAAAGDVDGYRLGRWARLTLTVTVLAAIAVVTVSLVAGSGPQAMVDVTVGPGDTLWSIAAQAAPDRDPRDVIEQIKALNQVPGDVLPVGVVLRVPSSVE